MLISLIMFSFILTFVASYNAVAPTWLTSPYFRAGNNKVINRNTGNNTTPTYTFTFSSSLTGVPNLAYGVKSYRGNFRLSFRNRSIERDKFLNKKDRFDCKHIFSFDSALWIGKFILVGSTFYRHRSNISTSFEQF